MIKAELPMIRLCYASIRVENDNDLLLDLSDILATAREFNAQQGIVGVLYYAEGAFFQCLEGESEKVIALFESIQKDGRHTDIYQFETVEINELHFRQWSMKYVNSNTKISNFFKKNGLHRFLPHQLSGEQIDGFLKILLQTANVEKPTKSNVGYQNRGYQNYF